MKEYLVRGVEGVLQQGVLKEDLVRKMLLVPPWVEGVLQQRVLKGYLVRGSAPLVPPRVKGVLQQGVLKQYLVRGVLHWSPSWG